MLPSGCWCSGLTHVCQKVKGGGLAYRNAGGACIAGSGWAPSAILISFRHLNRLFLNHVWGRNFKVRMEKLENRDCWSFYFLLLHRADESQPARSKQLSTVAFWFSVWRSQLSLAFILVTWKIHQFTMQFPRQWDMCWTLKENMEKIDYKP